MSTTITKLSDSKYRVIVDDGGSKTEHEVTVTAQDIARYAPGATAEALLAASFEFLLEHEPKESILRRFELPVIERYFSDYPRVIRSRVR
ncbi:MAG TPA: hypothetical protein VGH87_11740 [Polyangiaceae bacterium]|nr:hypothetical protein [Polyangiaceae bacterium]